jgi:hypothetical protein
MIELLIELIIAGFIGYFFIKWIFNSDKRAAEASSLNKREKKYSDGQLGCFLTIAGIGIVWFIFHCIGVYENLDARKDYKNNQELSKVIEKQNEEQEKSAGLAPRIEPILVVNSENLYKDYTANTIRADDRYLYKTIEVIGVLESINKTKDGKYMIGLTATGYQNITVCIFGANEEGDLAKLNTGEIINVIGICLGRKHEDPILDNCYLKGSI